MNLAKRIFITATNTDIGKTYATKLLMQVFSTMGYRVGVCKPIETGVETAPLDGTALLELLHQLNPLTHHLNINDIVPIQYTLPAAPYIASNAEEIDLSLVDTALSKQEALCDILLIEGAGGLYVPVDKQTMMIDLIDRFEAKALLISHCRLGCINDTLLSHYALNDKEISHIWTLNCHADDHSFSKISEPFFHDNFPDYTLLERDIFQVANSLLALFEK